MLDPILPQGGYNQSRGITSRERSAIDQALDRQQENPELAMMAQKIAALEARPVYTAGLGIRINGGVIDATGEQAPGNGNGGRNIGLGGEFRTCIVFANGVEAQAEVFMEGPPFPV